ncbi:MAG: alpha/beta fold hydrolase [Desulfobacteraceae bacterium]
MKVMVGGKKINICEDGPSGEGPEPLIVFVHGAGGDSSVWESQALGLSGRWRVLRLELPGHGESEGEGEKSIEAYAEWVKAAVREIAGSDGYVLAGHSMGGAVTLHIAASEPAGLAGIVLAGTGARLGVTPLIFKALEDDPEAFFQTIDRAAFGKEASAEVKDRLVERMRLCPVQVIYNDFVACDRFDMIGRVGDISVPALVICGDQDRLTPVHYSQYLYREIPGSRLVLVEGAGHMAAVEKPEEVNRAVDDFLEGLRSRS